MPTLTIDRLGHLGDGIAHADSQTIFVPGALPGEEVSGEIAGDILAKPRIVTPSPDRVAPPCRHAKACGGCQVQHASDAFVAGWKQDVVATALAAHGIETEFRKIATSPPRSRRRATFSSRRTKGGALAGFHQKRSDVIVSVPDCLVVHPDIAHALPLAEELARLGGSRKGELDVAVTRSEAGLDIVVRGGKPADGALRVELARLAEDNDLARLSWGEDETLERRPPHITFGPTRVTPPPGAFLQATPQGEAALRDGVFEAVGGAKRVADLFSGCGTFALPLSDRAEVHAIEASRAMLAALDAGWRHAGGLRKVTTEARDLFRAPVIAGDLEAYDAVVMDPPRAGAEAQVAEIAEAQVPRIAHVSCNPVTFARDSATLIRAGYRLDWVQVVDQFRWSTHVEIVAQLTLS
ncbi:RNA methyltransferase [Roseivivax halodurans JCM 10272]|uniref:RNA methyltransferase n=1 Tax=Roseivivax halodurans JCM 10272 TaxID=1449350 RepID=X7EIN8_9RHOB|nr:class I SAM-dependent RNA methyltransferase [Roseivivax halodurans]ETX15031.1 RNA methyltransferase [Roseivivax halodurans JCM 10272]